MRCLHNHHKCGWVQHENKQQTFIVTYSALWGWRGRCSGSPDCWWRCRWRGSAGPSSGPLWWSEYWTVSPDRPSKAHWLFIHPRNSLINTTVYFLYNIFLYLAEAFVQSNTLLEQFGFKYVAQAHITMSDCRGRDRTTQIPSHRLSLQSSHSLQQIQFRTHTVNTFQRHVQAPRKCGGCWTKCS